MKANMHSKKLKVASATDKPKGFEGHIAAAAGELEKAIHLCQNREKNGDKSLSNQMRLDLTLRAHELVCALPRLTVSFPAESEEPSPHYIDTLE